MPPPATATATALPLRLSSLENHVVRQISECASPLHLAQVHARAVTLGLASRSFVAAKLVRALSSFGLLLSARAAAPPARNAFVWTALIRGHASGGACFDALLLYAEMRLRRSEVAPLTFTLSSVLKAASHLRLLERGREIHCDVFKNGFHGDAGIATALVDFYAECGHLGTARLVFDWLVCDGVNDVQAWNTMIASYMEAGEVESAQLLFDGMPERNSHTYVEMIVGYGSHGKMEPAVRLFERVEARGEADAFIRTAMISAYATNGDVEAARSVFDAMKSRDATCWNAMIMAYLSSGHAEEALEVFRLMRKSRGRLRAAPNRSTILAVASACAQCGSMSMAHWVQNYVATHCTRLMNNHVAAALINMHSKCGDLERAYKLFCEWKHPDLVCYSAMISGFGMHGRGSDAVRMFDELRGVGITPDAVCFVAVLAACSHCGMIDKGREVFRLMIEEYSISPTLEHYICMVDLLGRAGCIEEACQMIVARETPLSVQLNASIWCALMSACRMNGNIEIGEVVAKRLLHLEPENAGNYVLLSSLYSNAGKWDKAQRVRALTRQEGANKSPGWSEVTADGSARKFVTGKLYNEPLGEFLELLSCQLTEHGYVPSGVEAE